MSGRFRLFKFQQAVGEETYSVDRLDGGLRLRAEFAFTDRGERVPLRAELRATDTFEPTFFEVEGRNARRADLHESVHFEDDEVELRTGGSAVRVARPEGAFPISGVRAGLPADGAAALLADARGPGGSADPPPQRGAHRAARNGPARRPARPGAPV
ncbi:hypothetical protein B2A_15074, partial [mine drainage metagenome]